MNLRTTYHFCAITLIFGIALYSLAYFIPPHVLLNYFSNKTSLEKQLTMGNSDIKINPLEHDLKSNINHFYLYESSFEIGWSDSQELRKTLRIFLSSLSSNELKAIDANIQSSFKTTKNEFLSDYSLTIMDMKNEADINNQVYFAMAVQYMLERYGLNHKNILFNQINLPSWTCKDDEHFQRYKQTPISKILYTEYCKLESLQHQ